MEIAPGKLPDRKPTHFPHLIGRGYIHLRVSELKEGFGVINAGDNRVYRSGPRDGERTPVQSALPLGGPLERQFISRGSPIVGSSPATRSSVTVYSR
jgi:hypothetical protein